ncbi:hypothetical protein [Spirillospora sp. CA-294931]|uniref:SLOG cluster 4 domain-containing protein n=1 Tax=Spirillospora sp. CA-294931 TaxID=3240042 RepID=UPI003D92B14C
MAIPTGMGQARNAIIALSGDAVIVVGGSWGTLSELALARRHDITVVQVGGWHLTGADGSPVEGVLYATTPEEAVRLTGLFGKATRTSDAGRSGR